MLYGLVRAAFGFVVFLPIILFVFIKPRIKTWRPVKSSTVWISIAAVVFYAALCYAPAENLFISFQSPQDVFSYTHAEKIKNVIYGDHSAMVSYASDASKTTSVFFPKSATGYKIPWLGNAARFVTSAINTNGVFQVFNVSGTSDYYVSGQSVQNTSEVTISDSNNSELKITIEKADDTDYVVSFDGYINNFTSDYYLMINGKKIGITSS